MDDLAKDISETIGLLTTEDSGSYGKIYRALSEISEKGVDTGYGLNGRDLWVTIDGREYLVRVSPSNKQAEKEAH